MKIFSNWHSPLPSPEKNTFKKTSLISMLRKNCFSQLSTIIYWNEAWLLLTFFMCLPNQLTLSWRRPLSYRKQSIDLRSKSMNWFLYDNSLRHERVKFYTFYCHILKSTDVWKRRLIKEKENEKLFLSVSFTAKFELFFALTQENGFFLEVSFLKPREKV